ncbi:trissin receptor-like isoform X2 [Euwallacea fornicatus]
MVENVTSYPDYMEANNSELSHLDKEDYIYDKVYIRIIFILLYTIVFCLCFFGNLLVILVVTLSGRLRGPTNFFLGNLAFADLCVAVFCVYQNLFNYIVESWILGDFLCKMYVFIQSLSNSASIVILVVICVERYLAILHPISSKQILTTIRLRIVMVVVWITCILYSVPKFFWGNTVRNVRYTGNSYETVCILNRQKYNSRHFDIIHFVLLYVIPLGIISILYTRIAICLWNSSDTFRLQLNTSANPNYYEPVYIRTSRRDRVENGSTNGFLRYPSSGTYHNNNLAQKLKSRRGVIKMLIIIVCAFALCNLPYHARKMWQYSSPNYRGHTNFSALLTPLTFLATYINSGINPLLYAFLSKNFRGSVTRGMREVLLWWKNPTRRTNLVNDRRCIRSTIRTSDMEMPMTNLDQNHFTHNL